MADETYLQTLVSNFEVPGKLLSAEPLGNGHIHDTYLLESANARADESGSQKFVLQRINNLVFSDIDLLMGNLRLALDQISSALRDARIAKLPISQRWKKLELLRTKNGQNYFLDRQGNYWRMFNFLTDCKSYDALENEQQAYAGGEALGFFQSLFLELDPNRLGEVIPNFHNIISRLEQLDAAKVVDAKNRLIDKEVQHLLNSINAKRERMRYLPDALASGALPLRVTHNDTKFNNVLLDDKGQAVSMIDLDTVMSGLVAYDFGDAIRTIVNTAAEDEADLSKISVDVGYYKAFAEGYLNAAGSFLTEAEINSLYEGALLLPYMQSVRFLTDYLNGDVYFKTAYPEHNLVRARAQFKLFVELERHQETLRRI